MGLRNPASTAATPAFESEDETSTETTMTENTAAPAAASAAAPALRAKSAVALPSATDSQMYVIRDLRDQLRVDFNTLAQVQATQGSFIEKETDKVLGDEITIELMSWQDSYVCSPNDDTAPKELVKYSEDGVTSKDGESLQAHLADLKAQGYDRARISHRVVLVGALLETNKDQGLVGELIQIDLPPTGKAQFDRYSANVAWKVRSGAVDPEAAKRIKLAASIAKGAGSVKYTLVRFS